MSWTSRLAHLYRRWRRGARAEADLDEEVQSYFETMVERRIAKGLTLDEARRAARLEFGTAGRVKENVREARFGAAAESALRDIRHAVRVLRKDKVFTTVALLSLTLGIGANTAVFSLMDVLLLRPLPVAQPDRLVLVSPDRNRYSFSYPLYRQVSERNPVFSDVFAWSSMNVQVPQADGMLLVPAIYASGNYFRGLGVAPALGRTFGPDDDRRAGGADGPVAVIADGFWARHYGRSAAALGQSIVINGVPVTIIGVMPRGFFGAEVGTAPDVWLPLNLARQLGDNVRCFDQPECTFMQVMARLRPEISLPQAEAALRVISRPSMEATLTPRIRADRQAAWLARTFRPEPGRSGFARLRSEVKNPLGVLMALVALVLLIACANIANLLTARASARAREVGVRMAMGAPRGRLVRQFLTESLVLALAGAAGGLLFALRATRLLAGILSNGHPERLDLQPDWRVLLFSAAAAIGSGVLFGIGPALRATQHGLAAALRERGRQLRAADRRAGFGKALLAIQVSLSVVLLAAAGLFAGTLIGLLRVDPGFDPSRLTIISIVNSRPPLAGPAAIRVFGRLLGRARAIPGVESATLLSTTPLTNSGWSDFFAIPGRPDLAEPERLADINVVATAFTKTMGISLVAGREFEDSDTPQSEPVALISDNAARRWFPKGDALGAEIRMGSFNSKTALRIVGIVGNSKYMNLREASPLNVYVPSTQSNQLGYVALRTAAPVRATYAAFRQILREEAPGMPIATIKTMEQQVDESLATERLAAYTSGFIGLLALLLTAVGLYGILTYSVARRTGEIGVRMALGAQRPSVVWLVVRGAMGHTAAGLAAGLAVVLALSHVVRDLLFDVQPNDPLTIAAAVGILALVCLVAALLPARRASMLDPMQVLREE